MAQSASDAIRDALSAADPKGDYHLRDAVRCAVPVGVFWLCTQMGQRLGGLVKFQYGRRGGNVAGFLVVASGAVTTLFVQRTLVDPLVRSSHKKSDDTLSVKEYITFTYVSLLSFVALGLKPMSSVLPSSVIQLGSFNKTAHFPIPGLRGSVPVASETASASQRVRIQRLGKLYGCHQCGSKQMLGYGNFIADHMPPTMQVKNENQKLWRRVLRFEMKQELWPQCQQCFSKQGSAVRVGVHQSIYNMKLRPHHFSVLVALVACESAEVRNAIDPVVSAVLMFIDNAAAICRRCWRGGASSS